MPREDDQRTPAFKLFLAIMVGLILTIPLFSVWLLVYDRQTQQQEATNSITAGWGGPQTIAGPVIVIPYATTGSETVIENGQSVTRTLNLTRKLTVAPTTIALDTNLRPELRKRSIYEAVVFQAEIGGRAKFALPADLGHLAIAPGSLYLNRAELRFAVSDPRGLGQNPQVSVNGAPVTLQPGGGDGRGFMAPVDLTAIAGKPIDVAFSYTLRGNNTVALAPQAGETKWSVRSPWPNPSFGGDFLPQQSKVASNGFNATFEIGNLALGQPLFWSADTGGNVADNAAPPPVKPISAGASTPGAAPVASISLIQPVDLYSQVNRATKYGFLFIGFTFLALLMFDVIGGVRVSAVEYLLMGAALVLFFVLLLAFAEVIGFGPAYVLASLAIAGLNTAYSAAVLGNWRRAALIGALLIALYAVLYILLSLEAYSLLIGSLLLFAALAGVMYATRRIDWGARRSSGPSA